MSVGSRIKELREDKEMSRSELADKIGVTIGAVSNYENEVSSPKEPILFKIMEVLGCDANYLFQDSINMPSMKNTFSVFEHNLIKKYRELDSHGKDMVNTVLQKEYERIVSIKGSLPAVEILDINVNSNRDTQYNSTKSTDDTDNIIEIDVEEEKRKLKALAAHHEGTEYTEDELKEIDQFKTMAINKKK